MAGGAYASNGDPNGSNTGPDVQNIVPAGSDHTDPTLEAVATQTEHNRVPINVTSLMLGGVLVLFMQAGFALVETGFTRAKNAAHTMMMNMVMQVIAKDASLTIDDAAQMIVGASLLLLPSGQLLRTTCQDGERQAHTFCLLEEPGKRLPLLCSDIAM